MSLGGQATTFPDDSIRVGPVNDLQRERQTLADGANYR